MEGSLHNKTGYHLQLQRLQRLQNACVDKDIFKNVRYNGENLNTKYYSSRYNFSICKVPKAGCSFFKQVFTILENGAQVSKDIFGVNRYALHHGKLRREDYIGFKRNSRRISRTVLVSRDPYTRLFSAFIDKMFLPLMYGAAIGIVQRQRTPNNRNISCANDITFEEFLSDIIDGAREGKSLNRHWAPLFALCNPCETNVLSLVKQETFSADVEYVLKEVGVAKDEFDVIHDALHDHNIDVTIPGIVATIPARAAHAVKNCMDRIEIARRIWVSFQIQGYIKEDIPFPINTINSIEKAKDPKFLTDVILEIIRKNPMSPDDSKLQRHRALVKAYDDLSQETLDKVKQLYRQDFILFDYSIEPPSILH